jgi:Asp-tRNA(Asn)/Glu-tRNA(Gln) amidotransferase A subunit family amidase
MRWPCADDARRIPHVRDVRALRRPSSCSRELVDFTGHPACSVPAGLVAGLPVGMQVIGRRFADADVLRVAAAVERLQPWAQAYPFRGE